MSTAHRSRSSGSSEIPLRDPACTLRRGPRDRRVGISRGQHEVRMALAEHFATNGIWMV